MRTDANKFDVTIDEWTGGSGTLLLQALSSQRISLTVNPALSSDSRITFSLSISFAFHGFPSEWRRWPLRMGIENGYLGLLEKGTNRNLSSLEENESLMAG